VIRNRYELGKLLGRGTTARVFRAHDRERDREVAIKLFHPSRFFDPRARNVEERRRLKEIQILNALQHPDLVTLYDAGTEEGLAFLAMRLVEGTSLADRIAVGPLATSEVIDMTIVSPRRSATCTHAGLHTAT
jgi:serine/threonine-protein kinase